MAQAEEPIEPKKKKRALPLILGLLGALLMGGGGFFAVWSGLLFNSAHEPTVAGAEPLPDIAFVAVPPTVISLPPGSNSTHLKFAAQLEVEQHESDAVTLILPRIQDVVNSYLRAVSVAELEEPSTLVRIRAHLLRRIQLVAGEGRVRDLLVTDFVLN